MHCQFERFSQPVPEVSGGDSGAQHEPSGSPPSSGGPDSNAAPGGGSSRPRVGTWLATIATLAAGWGAIRLMKSDGSAAPADPAVVAKAEPAPAEIVFPGPDLYKRFDEGGDLSKTAFQYVQDGLFSYELPHRPSAKNPASNGQAPAAGDLSAIDLANEKFVAIRGLTPGAVNDALVGALREHGVAIRDGESVVRMRQAELAATTSEQNMKVAREKGMWQAFQSLIVWTAVLGTAIYVVSRISKNIRAGIGLPGQLGGKAPGEVLTDRPTEGFDHIGGIPQVVAELQYLKGDIKLRQQGDDSIELPKGVLLHGDPGVGKTMLARSLAAETECPFVSFKGSELSTQFFVGSGVASVKNAFAKARSLRDEHTAELRSKGNSSARGVCIVFIDEFDSIAQARTMTPYAMDKEETKVVNTLLAELDNISKEINRDIVVVAATNSIEVLDPAVIRAGRFNKKIEVPKPDSKEARIDVIEKAMKFKFAPKGVSLAEEGDIHKLAGLTQGKSAADLVGILEKASGHAIRERRKALTFPDLMEGYLQQEVGYRSARKVPESEQRKTAWHEVVGHAAIGHFCGIACRLITMQPRGKTLGMVIPDPDAMSEFAPTKGEILRHVLVLVGGTIGEEKKYKDEGRTIGNSMDMRMARNSLRQLISTGLLGNAYAESIIEHDPRRTELADDHREILDKGLDRALVTARRLLAVVDEQVLEGLVDASIKSETELIGDQAEAFIAQHLASKLTPEKRQEVDRLIAEYLSNPLGDTKTETVST